MRQYDRVEKFNFMVLGIKPRPHILPEGDEVLLSYEQGIEEMEEYLTAMANQDHVDAVDACIDSIVFAMGRLYKLGISTQQYHAIFDAVMDYNMRKTMGVKDGREGFDAADAIHPKDADKPEVRIKEILKNVI